MRSSNDDPIEHIAEIGNSTVDRCHYAYAADEEAAIAMGLGLGHTPRRRGDNLRLQRNVWLSTEPGLNPFDQLQCGEGP